MQESANRTPCPFGSDCPESCALQEHRDGDPQAGRGLVAIGSPLRRASARRRTPTLSERLAARPTQTTAAPQMAEDISLIALAAWLHRASKRAEGEGDAIEAARLAQACEVVKHTADREREDQTIPAPRPLAAN